MPTYTGQHGSSRELHDEQLRSLGSICDRLGRQTLSSDGGGGEHLGCNWSPAEGNSWTETGQSGSNWSHQGHSAAGK